MLTQQLPAECIERGIGSRRLIQYVRTVRAFVKHFPYAADLPLDAAETVAKTAVFFFAADAFFFRSDSRRTSTDRRSSPAPRHCSSPD